MLEEQELKDIAQELIDNLTKERKTKQEEALQLEGAVQGINLFYLKLLQTNAQQVETKDDRRAEDSTTKVKSIKKKKKAK